MMAAKSQAAAQAFQKRESLSALQGLPLAERAERAVLNHGKEGFRWVEINCRKMSVLWGMDGA